MSKQSEEAIVAHEVSLARIQDMLKINMIDLCTPRLLALAKEKSVPKTSLSREEIRDWAARLARDMIAPMD